jgi:RNA polymerase subunit RPABC4/transcription elongation factor Spt4
MDSDDTSYECEDCGSKIDPDAKECPNCGASFEEEQEFENILISSDPFEIAAIESLLDDNSIIHSVYDDSLNTIYGSSLIRPCNLLVNKEQAEQARELIEEYRKVSIPVEKVPISGVKGWLLFFCIHLVMINTLLFFSYFIFHLVEYPVNFNRYPLLNTVFDVDIILTVVLLMYGIITGLKLWRVTPGAPEFALNYLNIFLFYTIFAFLLMYSLFIIEDVPFNNISQIFIGDLIRETISTLTFIFIWKYYLKNSERVKNTYSSEEYSLL